MDPIGLLVIVAFVAIFLIWIINPDHFNKINDAGYRNLDQTGKRVEKAAKRGAALWRLFRKR